MTVSAFGIRIDGEMTALERFDEGFVYSVELSASSTRLLSANFGENLPIYRLLAKHALQFFDPLKGAILGRRATSS